MSSKAASKPLVILFHRFGPYHIARLKGAAQFGPIVGLELSAETSDYAWDAVEEELPFQRETLFNNQQSRSVSYSKMKETMDQKLNELQPRVVAINGWWDNGAIAALSWCVEHQVPAIIMSETQATDAGRSGLKESIKRNLLKCYSAGFIGGKSHAQYLVSLGIPKNVITLGYDAVDNEYFFRKAKEVRKNSELWREKVNLPKPFFLTSNRFIPKKNLEKLIEAYSDYRKAVNDPWDLVLLGDGELRRSLETKVKFLKLKECMHFPGFQQVEMIPAYYGLANAFVHASTHEQWGLVVNEAMASEVPVAVSNECGSAKELIVHEQNGLLFDPYDRYQMMECLRTLHEDDALRLQMTRNALKTISKYSPKRFGRGIWKAALLADASEPKKKSLALALIELMLKLKNQVPGKRVS